MEAETSTECGALIDMNFSDGVIVIKPAGLVTVQEA